MRPSQLVAGVSERQLNLAIGLSLASWAVLGLVAGESGAGTWGLGAAVGVEHPVLGTVPGAWRSPVRWGISGINLLVGVLFMVRRPVIAHGGLRDIMLSLPGLLIAGVALKLAPPVYSWSVTAQALFGVGVVLTAWSFLCLGRSFAVLPARRGVVRSGAYRWVRHPAYSGELVMIAACALAAGSGWGWGVWLGAVGLVVMRARAEERVLAADAGYARYRACTPDRLLPGLAWLCGRLVPRRETVRGGEN